MTYATPPPVWKFSRAKIIPPMSQIAPCAAAVGLNDAIRCSRLRRASGVLLALSGIGLLLAAALPLREDAAGNTYDPGGHFVTGVTFFLCSALALVVLSVRMRGDPNWRGLANCTLGGGCVALSCFVVLGWFAIPDHAPLHAYAGLLQRATILVVTFPVSVTMGVWLLRLSHRPHSPTAISGHARFGA
jgi:hypothetical protein